MSKDQPVFPRAATPNPLGKDTAEIKVLPKRVAKRRPHEVVRLAGTALIPLFLFGASLTSFAQTPISALLHQVCEENTNTFLQQAECVAEIWADQHADERLKQDPFSAIYVERAAQLAEAVRSERMNSSKARLELRIANLEVLEGALAKARCDRERRHLDLNMWLSIMANSARPGATTLESFAHAAQERNAAAARSACR